MTTTQTASERVCTCWAQVALHDGHCCFSGPDDAYQAGQPIPCGHDAEGLAMHDAAARSTANAAAVRQHIDPDTGERRA